MKNRKCLVLALVPLLLLLLIYPTAVAQQSCPLPPAIQPIPRDRNMFSEEQEVDPGDAQSEYVLRRYDVVEDDDLNGYLQDIADRILEHMPPTELQFQFHLIEMPEMNAFSLTGGRVYVSRKLVVFARDEDEIAGVLSHEMGHIITHQGAIEFTRRFREVLGVRQVGDRADVFSKFQQYIENYARKPGRQSFKEEEEHQYIADQVALYATARAGYTPRALADFYDRFTENRGKTGSWISDLFGTISPESKRLREMVKNMAAIPASCLERIPANRTAEFQQWQEAVAAYSGTIRQEAVPGLISKIALNDPLRQDLSWLRFSPNGKFILAQDNSGISLLTREPFAVVFHIDAPEALPAAFSADSRSIIFYTPSLRIETWDVAEQKRTALHEVVLRKRCMQTALSPDGGSLACFTWDFELLLLDVASGSAIYDKKQFYIPSYAEAWSFMLNMISGRRMVAVHMGFSPDSRYFFAGNLNSAHLAFEIPARHAASLPSSIRDMTAGSFAFVDKDRVVAINRLSPQSSPIIRFPSGEKIDQVALGNVDIESPAHGDWLLVRPLKDYAVGVLDLKKKTFVASNRNAAMDVYDDIAVAERTTGELALYKMGASGAIARSQLPRGPLGKLKAAGISSEGSYFAMSGPSRGAVWNLAQNRRLLFVRSFHGACFDGSNDLYADFPEFHETKRQIGHIDLATLGGTETYEIGESLAHQVGCLLIVTVPRKGTNERRDLDIEVRDARSGKLLWSRHYPKEAPNIATSGSSMTLSWPVSSGAAKDELQRFPDLRAGSEKEDIFVEVVNVADGKQLGQLIVKTGKRSLNVGQTYSMGDWVIVPTGSNLVLAYSLSSAQEKGQVFGTRPALSIAANRLAVEKSRYQITLYDLKEWQERGRLAFSSAIAWKHFSGDGKTFFVITDNQDLYRISVAGSAPLKAEHGENSHPTRLFCTSRWTERAMSSIDAGVVHRNPECGWRKSAP